MAVPWGPGHAPVYPSPSGDTAKTLVLIGLILQGVSAILGLGFILLIATVATALEGADALLLWVLVALSLVGIVFVVAVYFTSYLPISERDYERARTPTLIWGILSLVLLFAFIPALLYLIAYAKLGEAITERRTPPTGSAGFGPATPVYAGGVAGYGGPYPPAAYTVSAPPLVPPPADAVAPPPPTPPSSAPTASSIPLGAPSRVPLCPRCGAPARFVPQYGRWFCYRDWIYL